MTPTPVGMRCPECSRERTKVNTLRSVRTTARATEILITINVIAFIAEVASGTPLGGGQTGTILLKGGLDGPDITQHHQYYRILTAGFLHYSLLHIAFNMFFLYILGNMLEPAIGRANFVAVYLASLLAGSFGALLFEPDALTVGASGACFGVLGATIAVAHNRRISLWQSGLALTLLINIVFSFSVAGISIGGHIGGLLAGLITGAAIVELAERRDLRSAALAACAAVGVVSVVGAIAVAGNHGLTPSGLTFG